MLHSPNNKLDYNTEKESLKNSLSPKTKNTLNMLPKYEERELKKLEFF